MRLLHVSDSYLGAQPFHSTEREHELWRGFARAVDAAAQHRCDVLVHAGGLLSDFASPGAVQGRLVEQLERARAMGLEVVLHADSEVDLVGFGVDVVGDGLPAIELCGAAFGSHPGQLAEQRAAVRILVRRVCVVGMPATAHGLPTLDPAELLAADAHYVALGGARHVQPVQPNAWYAGQTARVDVRDVARAGGLVVDIAPDGVLARIVRVTWPDRAHRGVLVDATGMTADRLHSALDERVDEVLGHRSAGDEPDAAPVVHVVVRGPACPVRTDAQWYARLQHSSAYSQLVWADQRSLIRGVLA